MPTEELKTISFYRTVRMANVLVFRPYILKLLPECSLNIGKLVLSDTCLIHLISIGLYKPLYAYSVLEINKMLLLTQLRYTNAC